MLFSSASFNSLDIVLFKLINNVHFCTFCSTLKFLSNLLVQPFLDISNREKGRGGCAQGRGWWEVSEECAFLLSKSRNNRTAVREFILLGALRSLVLDVTLLSLAVCFMQGLRIVQLYRLLTR